MKGILFVIVAGREVWASVRAEVLASGAENRTAFKYIDFTAKQMLPPHLSAEEIGGKSTLPSMDVDANISDDNIKALHAAMTRATGTPKWFMDMNQWFAVWERFCVVARCCGMLAEA